MSKSIFSVTIRHLSWAANSIIFSILDGPASAPMMAISKDLLTEDLWELAFENP